MKFSETHEWIQVDGEIGTIGVSTFAQSELGEIVFVELPQVGKQIQRGETAAVLESTKAAADVYTPVSGEIIAINAHLTSSPEWINQDPQGKGWLFKIRLSDIKELNNLNSLR